MRQNKIKINPFFWLLPFAVAAFLFLPAGQAQKSPDAIAFRVVGNSKHHSPARWYEENIKVKGSPSEVMVDGYRAVRDGRTVYVGASNYEYGQLFTNIYIISYNQEAETATVDIFGQILAHWRFNTNLETPGNCRASTTLACINDRECPDGDFCTSLKGEVVRNTRRLADIADIETLLESYKKKNGKYPVVSAGSYMAHKTLSVWPSWQEILGQELGAGLPIDPVNRLGSCPLNFDPITCWDETNTNFYGTLPDDLSATSTLPDDSEVYIYRVTPDGRAYTLSTNSVDPATIISGADLTDTITNRQPRIEVPPGSTIIEDGVVYVNIVAYSGKPFNYNIRAIDPDSSLESLNLWQLEIVNPVGWGSWVGGPPTMATTSVPNIKKLSAPSAGQEDYYYFNIRVKDDPLKLTWDDIRYYRISVINQPPAVDITPPAVSVVAGSNYLVTNPVVITAMDPEGNYPLTNNGASLALPAGFSWVEINSETFNITGMPTYVPASVTLAPYTITFTDSYGKSTSVNLQINLVNNPPLFTNSPATIVRVGQPYNYDADATDADGHTVRYRFGAAPPAGLMLDINTGAITGTVAISGNYTMNLQAYDGWGATTSRIWTLSVNTYCGDGVTQGPGFTPAINSEGVAEDCDDANTDNNDTCTNICTWSCQGFPAVDLTNGVYDNSIVFDETDSTTTVVPSASGAYLKLFKSMSTPYLWVANSNLDRISKLRTFDGYRKTSEGLDTNIWETRGSVLGIYPTGGSNPSRTAVNVETGDVWVANRAGNNITKLDIDGNVMKTCAVGSGPRGVAIEELGDVWVANYSSRNMMKISGNDTDCTIIQTVALGGAPYGLAMDSNNNVWVSNRGGASVQKYSSGSLFTYSVAPPVTPSSSCGDAGYIPYGITIDLNEDVWVANTCNGIYKISQAGAVQNYNFVGLARPIGRSRGVTMDINGGIWMAMDYSNQMVKIADPADPMGSYSIHSLVGGIFPVGAAGDSVGQIWAVNYTSGSATVFNQAGFQLGNYPVNPSGTALPYTYSDMSGLNRAMLFRSGYWSDIFDSGFNGQHWGEFAWDEVIPNSRTSVRIWQRAANSTSTLATTVWTEYFAASPSASEDYRVGRYLELRIELRSRDRLNTPVMSNLRALCSTPKTTGGPGCVDDGSGACIAVIPACGGGTSVGSRIDNCNNSQFCTITNNDPCPDDCTIWQYLSCGTTSFSAPDRTTFDMSALPAAYVPNNDWGYTTVYPKPTSWPATASSSKNIVVAVSTSMGASGYNGLIQCYDGTIYKRYSTSSSMTNVACVEGAPSGSQTVTRAMSPYTFTVPDHVYVVEIEAIGGGGGGGMIASSTCTNGGNGSNTIFDGVITGGGGQRGSYLGVGGSGGSGGGSLSGITGPNGGNQASQIGGAGGNLPALGAINSGFAYGRGGRGATDIGINTCGCGGCGCGGCGGGGGGSGGYYHGRLTVTPGDNINVVIGAGGNGDIEDGNDGVMIINW
jgi:hypothetical protein